MQKLTSALVKHGGIAIEFIVIRSFTERVDPGWCCYWGFVDGKHPVNGALFPPWAFDALPILGVKRNDEPPQ